MEADAGINRQNTRMFLTGSGGGGIAEQIGAKFVQEVTAVFAGGREAASRGVFVIELGGQDARSSYLKMTRNPAARRRFHP